MSLGMVRKGLSEEVTFTVRNRRMNGVNLAQEAVKNKSANQRRKEHGVFKGLSHCPCRMVNGREV